MNLEQWKNHYSFIQSVTTPNIIPMELLNKVNLPDNFTELVVYNNSECKIVDNPDNLPINTLQVKLKKKIIERSKIFPVIADSLLKVIHALRPNLSDSITYYAKDYMNEFNLKVPFALKEVGTVYINEAGDKPFERLHATIVYFDQESCINTHFNEVKTLLPNCQIVQIKNPDYRTKVIYQFIKDNKVIGLLEDRLTHDTKACDILINNKFIKKEYQLIPIINKGPLKDYINSLSQEELFEIQEDLKESGEAMIVVNDEVHTVDNTVLKIELGEVANEVKCYYPNTCIFTLFL